LQDFLKFLTDFSAEAGTLSFLLALALALIAGIAWFFKRKAIQTTKIKASTGGVVNTGTVNGDI
tara:strand:+ start:1014 stop:1205 length:192 start_codon:yes stop_codon:yes gene_type:complete